MEKLTWPDLVLPPINLLVLAPAYSFFPDVAPPEKKVTMPSKPRALRSLSAQVRGFCQNLS